MDSAPDASWQNLFMHYVKAHPLEDVARLQQIYEAKPSNEILGELTITCAPYSSTSQSLDKLIKMFTTLPFNYKSHLWAEKHFDQTYQAKWVPQKIPTVE